VKNRQPLEPIAAWLARYADLLGKNLPRRTADKSGQRVKSGVEQALSEPPCYRRAASQRHMRFGTPTGKALKLAGEYYHSTFATRPTACGIPSRRSMPDGGRGFGRGRGGRQSSFLLCRARATCGHEFLRQGRDGSIVLKKSVDVADQFFSASWKRFPN